MMTRRVLLGVAGGLAFWREEAQAATVALPPVTFSATPALLMNLGALQPVIIAMKVGQSIPVLYRATDLAGNPIGPKTPDPAIPYPVNAPAGSIATNPSWNQVLRSVGTLTAGSPTTYTALAPGADSIAGAMVSGGEIYVGVATITVTA